MGTDRTAELHRGSCNNENQYYRRLLPYYWRQAGTALCVPLKMLPGQGQYRRRMGTGDSTVRAMVTATAGNDRISEATGYRWQPGTCGSHVPMRASVPGTGDDPAPPMYAMRRRRLCVAATVISGDRL